MRKILFAISLIVLFSFSSCSDNSNYSNSNGGIYNYRADASQSNYYPYGKFFQNGYVEALYSVSNDSLIGLSIPILMTEGHYGVCNLRNGKMALMHSFETSKRIMFGSKQIDSSEFVISNFAAIDGGEKLICATNTGAVYVYDKKGTLFLRYYLDLDTTYNTIMSNIVATNNGFIVSTINGHIISFDNDLNHIWQKKFNARISKDFAVDSEGNIALYLNSCNFETTDTLVLLNNKGKVLWTKSFENQKLSDTPIFSNEFLYCGSYSFENNIQKGTLYKIDLNSKILWQRDIQINPRKLSVEPNGTLYVSGYNVGLSATISEILSFSPEGKQRWKLFFKGEIKSPVMLSENSAFVAGTIAEGRALFFIDKNNGSVLETISLNDYPDIHLTPSITDDMAIIFSMKDKFGFVRIAKKRLSTGIF